MIQIAAQSIDQVMTFRFNRRAALVAAASALFSRAGFGLPLNGGAGYPVRPVRLVVPFGAGSGTDFVARLLSEQLQDELGAPFIVENRAGANGTIGSALVAKASADGYTLLLGGTSTHSSAPSLFKHLPYDVEGNFEPIAAIVETQFLLVVRTESSLHTVRELAAWTAAHRGKASYGYGSATTQIAAAAFARRMNLSVVAIPYKSNPQAMTDLMGQVIDFMFIDQTTGLPQIRAGKLRALGVASNRRMSELPGVPTLADAGLKDFDVQTFVGLFGPAGLPTPIANRLEVAMANIMRKPTFRERLGASGSPFPPMSRSDFSTYLRAQRIAWASKVHDAGIPPE